MPRTETELTDEQAHKAKEVLRRLKADASMMRRAMSSHSTSRFFSWTISLLGKPPLGMSG